MEKFIDVTLKRGDKKISILQREKILLKKAGLLKEEKSKGKTKEYKDTAQTKAVKASATKAKGNITKGNIKE
jgi:hypothetical protein